MEKRKSVINLTFIVLNFYAIILEGVRHEIFTTIKYINAKMKCFPAIKKHSDILQAVICIHCFTNSQ